MGDMLNKLYGNSKRTREKIKQNRGGIKRH